MADDLPEYFLGRGFELLPPRRGVHRSVRNELEGAPPFEDGPFKVSLPGAMAIRVAGRDFAV